MIVKPRIILFFCNLVLSDQIWAQVRIQKGAALNYSKTTQETEGVDNQRSRSLAGMAGSIGAETTLGRHEVQGGASLNLNEDSDGSSDNSLSAGITGTRRIRKLTYNGSFLTTLNRTSTDYSGISLLEQLERRRVAEIQGTTGPTEIERHSQDLSLGFGYAIRRNFLIESTIELNHQRVFPSDDQPESLTVSANLSNRLNYSLNSTKSVITTVQIGQSTLFSPGDRDTVNSSLEVNQEFSSRYGRDNTITFGVSNRTTKSRTTTETSNNQISLNYSWTHTFQYGEFTSSYSRRESEAGQDEVTLRDITSQVTNNLRTSYTHNFSEQANFTLSFQNQRLDPLEGVELEPTTQRIISLNTWKRIILSRLSSMTLEGFTAREELESEVNETRINMGGSISYMF